MIVAVSILLAAQLAALAVVLGRLARGRHRLPAVEPLLAASQPATSVTVIVPARNEAERIGPCLEGLRAQGPVLMEAIVVDGGSTDATPALVERAAALDLRIRRVDEPPRPPDAVGRPWAIAAGCEVARGEWVMVVDADTAPNPGMIAGAVAAAQRLGLDAVSFAPRIVAPGAGARWLQPSFLVTLVYRFGPAGLAPGDPARVMANGQCQLIRKSVLERAGGYAVAANSFCDDVRIARHLASRGARVAFLDGRELFDVVMYPTARETWRAWPPSLTMRDATTLRWRVFDGIVLILAQAAPIPLLILLALFWSQLGEVRSTVVALSVVNAILLAIRLLLSVATAHSFARRGVFYWLAPLGDVAVVLRVVAAALRPVREWRGAPVR